MVKYTIKRLLQIIPVIIAVAIVIFTVMYFTPGDPVSFLLPSDASMQEKQELRESLGLADPYFVQLVRFLKEFFLQGKLGTSYMSGTNVMDEMMARLPRTAIIALISMLLQIVIGIPLGINASTHQNGWQDRACIGIAMITTAIPGFWFAMILIIVFALNLNWLPSSGIGNWYNYIMPCIANGLLGIGGMARQTRSQMLEVLRSDAVTTARAKGVSERSILYKHALPNALIPIVTGIGTGFGRALGGSVVIETVFSIPGTGMYIVDAIGYRDYPVIRGGVTLLAVLFCLVIALTDITYAFLDPRIKAQYEGQSKKRLKKNEA